MFLVIAQVAVVLHVRNVLTAAAAAAARYGANADRAGPDAARRARDNVATALSPTTAARLRFTSRLLAGPDGQRLVEVTISGPLPLVFLPAGPLDITVHGHAVKEGG